MQMYLQMYLQMSIIYVLTFWNLKCNDGIFMLKGIKKIKKSISGKKPSYEEEQMFFSALWVLFFFFFGLQTLW